MKGRRQDGDTPCFISLQSKPNPIEYLGSNQSNH